MFSLKKFKVHKFRSVRPTTNQFQKKNTKPVLTERKQENKNTFLDVLKTPY